MNTKATNVAGLSQTNNHLIRYNSANHLASFLNCKRTNTEIDARKRTEEAPNDDGARDQAEPETNLSDKMSWAQSGEARLMEENANEAEFAHAWSRKLGAYSMRRSGRPQRAKHPNQPQPANSKAAMTEANEIKKEPNVKTEPQWNITKDALRRKKHLTQNPTPQVTQGINDKSAGSSSKTAGARPFATPAISQDPKLLILHYTPGRDPLEAPRGPRSRLSGPYANSVSSSSLSPAPTASPLSSYSVPHLPSYKEAQLERVGMPCANCSRTRVQTHYRGPTGYTLCDACHRLWTTDGRPFSWRGLGHDVMGQAFSADARQTASTPAMPSSKLVDYSDEEPMDSGHSNSSFNSYPGHIKSKPSQAPMMTPAKDPFPFMEYTSARDTAGAGLKPTSSTKRAHGATGPFDHNRPYKMPRKNEPVLSLVDTEPKDETPETGGVSESSKAKPMGVVASASDDKTHKPANYDGKKELEDTVQTFTILCRKLFELEKLEKEDQARVQRGEQALEEAKEKMIANQNEIRGLVITMNYTDKTVARQRESIAEHAGRKHSGYQQLVQNLVGQEAKIQKHHERFLELVKSGMEVEGHETLEDRAKRYRRNFEDTTRELKKVREKLQELTGDGS